MPSIDISWYSSRQMEMVYLNSKDLFYKEIDSYCNPEEVHIYNCFAGIPFPQEQILKDVLQVVVQFKKINKEKNIIIKFTTVTLIKIINPEDIYGDKGVPFIWAVHRLHPSSLIEE